MFNTVIWATDGSAGADRALPFAKNLAAAPGAKLVAVHVLEILTGRAGGYPARADESELVNELKERVDSFRADGLDASLRLVTSRDANAAHSIAEVALEMGGDVIVVGTRGHGAVAGLLLGSVAQRLLHVAQCAVLAVPPRAVDRKPEKSRDPISVKV